MIGRIVNLATSVINQDYTGDITILPPSAVFNPLKLLTLRSEDEVMAMIRNGEKATWPKIEMIRMQTQISRKLDSILDKYEHQSVHNLELVRKAQ
ncbi:MAG: hypothetical protein HON92_08120 [Planctomycetaceae bacterium]|jgi:NTE family protein|nr:hypothetical protein [Planctomycetaceae bacterium]